MFRKSLQLLPDRRFFSIKRAGMQSNDAIVDDVGVYGGDGYTAQELFGNNKKSCYAYTYDDVIILPGHITSKCTDISLESHITRNIKLKIPLLSSPMDTVTEHTMAINMALLGAIGIIHYNMTLEEQVHEVQLVKKYKNGFIANPYCLSPDHVIADVDKLKQQFGFSGFPITLDGKMGSKLVGIVCHRDIDYIEDRSTKLKDVMTTNLFTGTFIVNSVNHRQITEVCCALCIVRVSQLPRECL
jgi:IMP dehydrogenase